MFRGLGANITQYAIRIWTLAMKRKTHSMRLTVLLLLTEELLHSYITTSTVPEAVGVVGGSVLWVLQDVVRQRYHKLFGVPGASWDLVCMAISTLFGVIRNYQFCYPRNNASYQVP